MFDIKKYVNSKDKIIINATQDLKYRSLYLKVVIAIFSLIFLPIMTIIAIKNSTFATMIPITAAGYVMLFFLIWLGNIYYKSVHYCVTKSGIYRVSGLININVVFVPYDKITDMKLNLGIIERQLDVGTIMINTAGGCNGSTSNIPAFISYKGVGFGIPTASLSQYELIISHIKNPQKFMSEIQKNMK